MKKSWLLTLILCSMAGLLTSCASNRSKFYIAHTRGEVSPDEVAYIVPYQNLGLFGAQRKIRISNVDGGGWVGVSNWDRTVEVLPGQHVIEVDYSENELGVGSLAQTHRSSTSSQSVTIEAEAGRTYLIDASTGMRGGEMFWEPTVQDITGQKGDLRLKR